MSRKNYPDQLFYEQIEKMTLPDLEYFIEELSDDMKANHKKINVCLSQRKNVLKNMFECTPENVERLHCISTLINDNVKMLHDKGNQLYAQMSKLWQDGENKPFTDFYIEISLRIHFNDEETSILHLDDDKTGSNYVRMAELLDDFSDYDYNLGNLILHDTIEPGAREYFKFLGYDQEMNELDWGEPCIFNQFPELREIPITWEFRNLLFYSKYALQDIIRVNDVWCEAKVVWQRITGQKSFVI